MKQTDWPQPQAARLALSKAGELVEAKSVQHRWVSTMFALRVALLAIPSRVQQALPHLGTKDIEVPDREIRAAREAFSERPQQKPETCLEARMYKLMTALLVVCVAAPVYAQNPDQQGKDSYECNQIAVSQTGYNPAAPQAAATPRGQALRGGAGGAAIGAAGGAIGGNAAKGAAMGAAVGGGVGAIRGRRQRKQAEQQQASSQQSYKAAFAACMQSRGWNVH